MDHVILFRNPYNGRVGYVSDKDDQIEVFPNRDAAIQAAFGVPILQVADWQLVELDEL